MEVAPTSVPSSISGLMPLAVGHRWEYQIVEHTKGVPRFVGQPMATTGSHPVGTVVLELTGSRSELREAPLPQDDPLQRQPVLDLAEQQLDWRPSTPLRDGLLPTIAHFRAVLGVDTQATTRPNSVPA